MATKRIGILTSGGDCPGLNAVIRGAVKACHQLGYDCVGFLKGYEGLYDPVQYVHLTPDSTRGILNQGGTILGSTNKGRFAATVGVQDRQEIAPHLIAGVKQTIDQLGIDGLICVGGDGSLAVAQQFHEQGIPVVGVPKTIDNDLSATAFTFGFDSAIECATDALDRLHTTAASHERIMVLEVMGRHAGWIALHAGIAGGGDVILIPEIPWTYEHLCHKILHRESQGKKFTLVVVAEGAQLPGGDLVGESRNGQQMKLGGLGRSVAEEIEQRLHRETRLSVLGHLQRGGSPTTFDRVLATQFGAHAVRLVMEGRFGEMICSRPPEMTSVPIIEAVNVLRQVDPYGPCVQAARALGISFGDRAADEIGHNVFDRLEPVSHVVVEGDANTAVAEAPLTDDATAVEVTTAALTADTTASEPDAQAAEPVEDEPGEPATSTEVELPETDAAGAADSDPPRIDAELAREPAALEESLLEAEPSASDALVVETEPSAIEPAAELASDLAAKIADAARATRDAAPGKPEIDAETSKLTVAELVQQKLAAAAEVAASPSAAGSPPETAPTAETVSTVEDEPHQEDLLAEARLALEKALAD
ncbi:MAG: ATP-dependent 6-phosphofructokinase [Planctomycetota bacterium]